MVVVERKVFRYLSIETIVVISCSNLIATTYYSFVIYIANRLISEEKGAKIMDLIFLHLKRIVISAYHDRVSVFVLLIGVFIVPTLTLIFVNWESNRFIQVSAGNNPHFQIRRVQTAVINMITPEFMLSIPDVNVSINEGEGNIYFNFTGMITEENVPLYFNKVTYAMVGLITDFYYTRHGLTPPISPNFLIVDVLTAQEISERTSLEINELYNLDDFGILIRFLENNGGGRMINGMREHFFAEEYAQRLSLAGIRLVSVIFVISLLIVYIRNIIITRQKTIRQPRDAKSMS